MTYRGNKRRYTDKEYRERSRKRFKAMDGDYRNLSPAMLRRIRNERKNVVVVDDETERLMDELDERQEREFGHKRGRQ